MNRINQLRTALLIGGILYVVTATAGFNSQANVSTSSNTHFFIENKGQWPDEVRYLASIAGMNAWITNNGVVYDHFITERNYDPADLIHLPIHERRKAEMESAIRKGHVVKMNLKGSNLNATSAGNDKKPGYYNYFKGNDPERWASYVPLYGQIEILEVYEGIKVKYYFDGGLLRYDFYVQPGADINQIRFSLNGQDALKINEAGELVIETSLGEVTHGRLYAYQFSNGKENEVACRFLLKPDGTLGIVAENYDPAKELVIDPLVFSTFLGGSDSEYYPSMELTQDGDIIITGETASEDYPTTIGAYQTVFYAATVLVVSKLDSSGSDLSFSTFLGGNHSEFQADISLGLDDCIFITGTTQSTDFPVTNGAFQTSNPGKKSPFITKLNASGSSLIFSTYLGGSEDDWGNSIVVDQNGHAYITGYSESYSGFPTTPGTIHYQWGTLFISKLNYDGSSLIYSAIFAVGQGNGIELDELGNAYLTGIAYGGYFPITPNAFQTAPSPFANSAFAMVVNPTATEVLYSTYLTGSNSDYGVQIAVAQNGDIIVGGNTWSTDFPTSTGSFQPEGNGYDSFIIRLNASCTEMVWGTFLGGFMEDKLFDMTLDPNENVIVTGYTWSSDFPVTTNIFIGNFEFFEAAFISIISNDGSDLIYSALLSSNYVFSDCRGHGVRMNAENNIVLVGTAGPLFDVTPGAYQTTFGGGFTDFFVATIIPVNCQTECSVSVINHVSCSGGNDAKAQSTPSGGIPPYTFLWSDGQTSAMAVNLTAGTYTVIVTDSIGCTATESITIEEPLQLIFDTITTNPASCFDSSDGTATVILSGGTPPYTFAWSNGENGDTAIALIAGEHNVIVTDANGCEEVINFSIGHIPAPVPEIISTGPASCANSLDGIAVAVASGGTPPYTFAWSNGETGETAGNLPAGNNWLVITDSKGCVNTIEFETDYIRPYAGEVICAVSVDTASGNNIVYWMKTDGVRTTAYNIYREAGASGQYEIVGNTFFTGPSMYEDVPANPSQQSHRYKIAVVDSCQEESALSPYHKTMHLAISSGGNNEINLQWNAYQGFDYTTHFIYRSLDHGAYSLIGQVPSSNMVFTDLAAPSGIKKYFIEIHAPESCGTEMNPLTVHSNIVTYDPTGAGNLLYDKHFRVYPNPGEGFYKIDFTGEADGKPKRIEVINQLGMVIQTHQVPAGENYVEINLHEHPNGIYFIRVIVAETLSSVKVVKL